MVLAALAVIAIAGSVLFWDAGDPARGGAPHSGGGAVQPRAGAPAPSEVRSPATTVARASSTPAAGLTGAEPSVGSGSVRDTPSTTRPPGPEPETATTVASTPPEETATSSPPALLPATPDGLTGRGSTSGVDGGADTTK